MSHSIYIYMTSFQKMFSPLIRYTKKMLHFNKHSRLMTSSLLYIRPNPTILNKFKKTSKKIKLQKFLSFSTSNNNSSNPKNKNKPKSEEEEFEEEFKKTIEQWIKTMNTLLKDKKKRENNNNNNNKNSPNIKIIILITAITTICYLMYKNTDNASTTSFQEFENKYLTKGKVSRIYVINKKKAIVVLKENSYNENFNYKMDEEYYPSPTVTSDKKRNAFVFYIGDIDSFEEKMDKIQTEMGIEKKDFIPINYIEKESLSSILYSVSTIALIGYLLYLMYGRERGFNLRNPKNMKNIFTDAFGIGKSNPTIIEKGEKVNTTFNDVAGLKNAKLEVTEFIDFLRDKDKFTKLGAKLPKGALLVGPPGTGKTLLAKAIAGESNCTFFSISGSDFIEMFVGVGPSRVRDLFSKARLKAPSIIFIDEIDAVGQKRSGGGMTGGNDERDNTLNQLLIEMDGFSTTTGVVVIAGTNRVDILDNALLRPGRFDRQILIDLPDLSDRELIFELYLKKLTLTLHYSKVAIKLAALTPGFSGADIKNVCNEGAILAGRRNKKEVELKDFEDALDRIIAGLKKSNSFLSKEEKKIIAYHEAGHAIVCWFTKYADPLLKVTIIPRTSGAMGFTQYLPKEITLYNVDQLKNKMCVALGGRISEEIYFNHLSTGASNDLKRVTELAYKQVREFGMNERIGHLSFPQKEGEFSNIEYSDSMATIIDEEVQKMIKDVYNKTKNILMEKKENIKILAEKLLQVETLSHDEIVDLIGPREFTSPYYTEYLKSSKKAKEISKLELERNKKINK